jgi:hypothetical protein
MPTLADIYSAADSFKRRLSDAAMNPGASLQQMLGYANDQARDFNQLQQQATGEIRQGGFANQGPATQALNQAYMEAAQVPAATVWHGSPHVFESFDASKMGAGVGRSAYGPGLYMTETPEVAKGYMSPEANSSVSRFTYKGKPISPENEAKQSAAFHLMANEGDKEAIMSQWKPAYWETKTGKQFKKELEKMNYEDLASAGSLYKVDLPDTHVRRMLDWDAPIKDQPYPVRNLAKKLGMDMNDLGGDLIGQIGKGEEGKQMLQQAGIPGIKYLGQERGNTGRNFVVFDPNHLTILERNAKPIK